MPLALKLAELRAVAQKVRDAGFDIETASKVDGTENDWTVTFACPRCLRPFEQVLRWHKDADTLEYAELPEHPCLSAGTVSRPKLQGALKLR